MSQHIVNPLTYPDIAEALRRGKNEDIPIGAATRVLSRLSPVNAGQVKAAMDLYEYHNELGRHGVPSAVTEHFKIDDEDTALRFHGALRDDYIARKVQERMAEHDPVTTNPSTPDEPTSRDTIEAAFELHNGE